jgi:poly(hydroxyalkanoate) granule-associated protein
MNEARESLDSGFDKLLAAGRNLWLAGLGAVAEVEEEGRGLFDRLVERGRPVEGKQKKLAETLTGTITERANKAARELGKLVEETVEFESRGVLRKLNLMTREDVKILSARLETLSKKIDEYAVRREAAAKEVPVILNAEGEPARKVEALKKKAAPRPSPVKSTETVKTVKAATAKARGTKKG